MRTCTKCGKSGPDSAFGINRSKKSGFNSNCKQCRNKYAARWYAKNADLHKKRAAATRVRALGIAREWVFRYLLTHPCVDCGERDPVVLEFDHVRGDKKYIVSRMVIDGYGLENIGAEVEKCEVRCASCHRRVTAKRASWWIYSRVEESGTSPGSYSGGHGFESRPCHVAEAEVADAPGCGPGH